MEFKEALKIFRNELSMTQSELAAILQINIATVNRWENGKCVPSSLSARRDIMALAKCKNVSPQCLGYLDETLNNAHKELLNVPDSNLYSVERDTICQLVDDSMNAIYVCDAETDELLYVNHRTEQIVGRKFDSHAHTKCYYFLHGFSEPCNYCPKEYLMSRDRSDTYIVSDKNGRQYHASGRTIIWNGKKAHAQYFTDATDSLEAQNGLNSLINSVDVGICICYVHDDGTLQMPYANDGYYNLIGIQAKKRRLYSDYAAINAVSQLDNERVTAVAVKASRDKKSFKIVFDVDAGETKKSLKMSAKYMTHSDDKSIFYCTVSENEKQTEGDR